MSLHLQTTWGAQHQSVLDVKAYFNNWTTYQADLAGYELHSSIFKLGVSLFKPSEPISDLGCGPGSAGLPWIKEGYTLHGYDLSETLLEQATSFGYSTVQVCNLLDVGHLKQIIPFSQGLCIGVLGDYVPAEIILPELTEALLPGGTLLFTIENTYYLKYLEELELLLSKPEVTYLGTIHLKGGAIRGEVLQVFKTSKA